MLLLIVFILFFSFSVFFFSSRRRHTRCALVTGVQTCALPISLALWNGASAVVAHVTEDTSRTAHVSVQVGRALRPDAAQIGRASCRERVCSVRVDLGGRRIIKKKNIGISTESVIVRASAD